MVKNVGNLPTQTNCCEPPIFAGEGFQRRYGENENCRASGLRIVHSTFPSLAESLATLPAPAPSRYSTPAASSAADCHTRCAMKTANVKRAIQACILCAERCETCAAMCLCLGFTDITTLCFRSAMDCAFVCRAAAECMSYDGESARKVAGLCVRTCRLMARQSGQHALLQMQEAAQACEQCAKECALIAPQDRADRTRKELFECAE